MNMACITVRKPKGRCCKYSDYFDDLFITDSMSRDDKYIVIINHGNYIQSYSLKPLKSYKFAK